MRDWNTQTSEQSDSKSFQVGEHINMPGRWHTWKWRWSSKRSPSISCPICSFPHSYSWVVFFIIDWEICFPEFVSCSCAVLSLGEWGAVRTPEFVVSQTETWAAWKTPLWLLSQYRQWSLTLTQCWIPSWCERIWSFQRCNSLASSKGDQRRFVCLYWASW